MVLYDNLERKGCPDNLAWLRSQQNAHNLKIQIGDIRLPSRELQQAVEESDAVFHMAGQVAVTTSVTDAIHDFEVNGLSTVKLLEIVRNSPRKKPAFFYTSTGRV